MAELVLSELVTNALKVPAPADQQVRVRIAHLRERGVVRLEVSDPGGGRPVVRRPGDDEPGGRGMLLVESLSERWGAAERACGIGKTVWAEIKVAEALPPEVLTLSVPTGQCVQLRGSWRMTAV